MRIDLNADVGEFSGGESPDAGVMPHITSANIACGFHAGDLDTMRATVALAKKHRVAIGAHPSFPDREGFGRRSMKATRSEIEELVVYQIAALAAVAAEEDVALEHVKPHGALYNLAAENKRVADAIAQAIAAVDPDLLLYGLSNSELIRAGERAGLRTVSEAFVDRGYQGSGRLVPRDEPDAVLTDAAMIVERSVRMARDQKVIGADRSIVRLRVETLCVHGDTPGASTLAASIRRGLEDAGVSVMAPAREAHA